MSMRPNFTIPNIYRAGGCCQSSCSGIKGCLPLSTCPKPTQRCNANPGCTSCGFASCQPCNCIPCRTIRIVSPHNGGSANPTDPVTGQGTPFCRVELYIDGRFAGCVCVDAGGNWVYRPAAPWTGGRHCVRAILRCPGDNSGNPPEDTSCFCVAQGTEIHITAPQDGGSADPETPVTGTGEPGCEAELFVDGVPVGRVPIAANGAWTYQPPLPWNAGVHCVRAILRCECASPVPPEDSSCFEVPGIEITGPEDGGGADPEDPVTGTGEPGCEAELFVDGVPVGRVPIGPNGEWVYEPSPPWSQGRHCVRAVLRCPDSVNPNPPQDEVCFDVVYPACPPPPIDLPELNEVIASSRPSIAGRGIPNSQVQVCVQNSLGVTLFCETTTLFEDGEWGVQSPTGLPDGTYTVVATQLGALCNPTDASRTFSIFTIDTSFLNVNLISLVRGQTFRTVDMVMTGSASPDTTLSIYYLLLTPGQPVPTAEQVIGYSDPVPLTTGHAVRGQFTRSLTASAQTFPFTLTGKENIAPLPLETGVMDGFNYDIYVVGVTSEGRSTGVLTRFESAMGMPVASGNGVVGDPFFVRMCTPAEMAFYPDLTQGNPGNRAGVTENARILDNIEGMQALYDQTEGVHGMSDSLALVYSLDSAFDLSNYASAWGGNGWRPIGNVDAGHFTAPLSGEHVFTGVAQTAPGGTSIANLTINAIATPVNPVLVRGLFGQARNVTLDQFTLIDAFAAAMITGTTGGTTGKIGTLVGYMQGGAITDIALNTAQASGGRATSGTNVAYVGGMAGVLEGTAEVANIAATQLTVTEVTALSCNAGGLIGLLNQAGASTEVRNLSIDAVGVTGYQNQGGVIGLVSAGLSTLDGVTVLGGTFRFFDTACGGMIGRFNGSSPSALTNLTMAAIQSNQPNPPASAAHHGGLIGYSTLTAATAVSNAVVGGGSLYANNRLGGAFGTVEVRSNNQLFLNISCAADVFGRAASMGGVFGARQMFIPAGPVTVDNCHCTAATVSAMNPGASAGVAGGFAGHLAVVGAGTPTVPVAFVRDCTASAEVISTGQECGGFVGRSSGTQYLRCRADGAVTCQRWLGGFLGNTDTPAPADPANPSLQFMLCQARGDVTSTAIGTTSTDGTGGFGGNCAYGLVDRCFATGTVTVNQESESGGLVGLCHNSTTIVDSYATGGVTANNTQVGALLGHGRGTPVLRCYASGSAVGASIVAGLVGALETSTSGPAHMQGCIALGASAVATSADDVVHRVCGQLLNGATLAQNHANSAMILLSDGVPVVPVSDPNGLDGQSMNPPDLLAVITALGWNTASVWNTATIGTLGRPTLFGNPET